MAVFLAGSGLFVLAFVIHLVWWRIRLPRRQSAALLALFAVTAAAGFAAIYALDLLPGEFSLPRLLLAVMLFGGYAVVYVILFSALEADSPTLTLIGIIAAAGDHGIHRSKLMQAMEQHSYVRLRIDQMIADGMAVEVGSRVHLAAQGLWLSSLVILYRRLLARNQLGG
jgi:hypothetical protein